MMISNPSNSLEWMIFLAQKYSSMFIKGTWLTLYISVVGTLLGFVLGYIVDYYKYYTHGNYWTNPVNYDLTLNSERVGVENCVKTIEQYLIIKGFIKADMIKPVGELI